MQAQNYDAIVVGSGISGGWAAKELTEKGLRVLLLERGKNIEHVKDYVNATKAPWDYPHRGGRTQAMEHDYPVLKRDYPLNEKNLDWWASDKDSPYTEVKRFDWYRGYHVGGRSLLWGRQSYRWSDFDFEANAREGVAVDWPIRYADIAQWYDYVERHAGISGSREGLAQLPDGQFQPAMRRVADRRTAEDQVRRPAPHHPGPHRERHGSAARTLGMSVSQRVLARLSIRWILQYAVLDVTGRDGYRPSDAQAVCHRHRSPLRSQQEACDWRARARCGELANDRLHRAHHLRVCLHVEFRLAAAAVGDGRVAGRFGKQLG